MTVPPAPAQGAPVDTTSGSSEISREFRKLLNDAMTSAAGGASLNDREQKLLRDNYKVRERLRLATEAAGKVKPLPDGAVVLEGDDAKHWTAIKALNVPLAELPTRLAERDALKAEEGKRAAQAVYDSAAKLLDIPNVRGFRRLAESEGLEVTIETQKVRGEDGEVTQEQVAMVRKRGAAKDAKAEPLAELLERDYAEDIPALLVAPETSDASLGAGDMGAGTETGTQTPARRLGAARGESLAEDGGVPFPAQRSTAPIGPRGSVRAEEKQAASKLSRGTYSM